MIDKFFVSMDTSKKQLLRIQMKITEFENASFTIIWKTTLSTFLSQRLKIVESLMECFWKDIKFKILLKAETITGETFQLEWS